ncbi:putative alanine racemase-domain-containing protein [Flammula alnicola]|nr:putative alanine racemase-domain-containing protein [Flammula alnicola]
MAPVSDALTNPTKALCDLFSKNRPQPLDQFPATVTEYFKHVFEPEDAFSRVRVSCSLISRVSFILCNQIPELNSNRPPESFANGSLVVFKSMVQDTSLSPELYLAIRKNGDCGGWGITDDLASGDDVEYANLRECTAAWAVSIPGFGAWCADITQPSDVPPHQPVQAHKYPIPNAPHIGVQLKIYDEKLAQPLRTTDLASFVGILTSEPLHAGIDLPTPVNVPTLHVLFSTPIPSTIVPRLFPEPSIIPTIKTLREELIKWIADEGLAGDQVAAEWVLLSAIARVRSRHPPVLPLSLTISSFPSHATRPDSPPVLYDVLSHIFPLVVTVPLALNTLNTSAFRPESKEEDLHSGQLQLPKGSILLLTEGAVTEGGIFSKGVMNIRAAQEMMKSQTLEYVFPYSSFQFETDVNFLITTEGKQSTFFQTDVNVPLRPVDLSNVQESLYKSATAISLPPPDKLLQFRQLVGGAKIGNVTVADAMGQHVEEDFVRERSSNKENKTNGVGGGFTPDDLIQRMLVARLTALSWHQTEVTVENWENAKKLERERRKGL